MTSGVANGGWPSFFARRASWIYFCLVEDKVPHIWKLPVYRRGRRRSPKSCRHLGHRIRRRPRSLLGRGGGPAERALARTGQRWHAGQGPGRRVQRQLRCHSSGASTTSAGRPPPNRSFADPAARRYQAAVSRLRHGPDVDRCRESWRGHRVERVRDGRTVFFSRVDSSIDELMVVNDFR